MLPQNTERSTEIPGCSTVYGEKPAYPPRNTEEHETTNLVPDPTCFRVVPRVPWQLVTQGHSLATESTDQHGTKKLWCPTHAFPCRSVGSVATGPAGPLHSPRNPRKNTEQPTWYPTPPVSLSFPGFRGTYYSRGTMQLGRTLGVLDVHHNRGSRVERLQSIADPPGRLAPVPKQICHPTMGSHRSVICNQ